MSDNKEPTYTAALIGCGRIGYSLGLDKKREQPASHTMALAGNPRISLIAGCDTDMQALNIWRAANRHAIVYNDSANLYARQKPDIVVVAVNESAHLKEAIDAINVQPRLVILEKPVALNLPEAFRIQDAARDKNVPVLVNHERRFAEDYILAKQYIPKIGLIQSISANLYSSLRVYSRAEERTGAYSLLHDGTHLVDIVLYLLGTANNASEVIQIQKEAKYRDIAAGGGLLSHAAQIKKPEGQMVNTMLHSPVVTGVYKDEKGDVRNLSAHYSNSVCPDITISMSGRSRYFGFDIDVRGTEGRICIGNGYLKLYKRAESRLYSGFYSLERDRDVKIPKRTLYFANMVQNAVDFLDGKAELKSTLQDGINALTVLEEIKSRIKF